MIPELFSFKGSVDDWISNKRHVLILGIKKSLSARANTRSSRWVAPSEVNGCTMACSYCYVPRRKGFSNPITMLVNIEQIMRYLGRHAAWQGMNFELDEIDPKYWVYEIGENGDCSADAAICDNVKDLFKQFTGVPNGNLTFAAKFVNRELLTYDPQLKTRIWFSLMPHKMSKLVDVRITPISESIDVMNDFGAAGYEVYVNFSSAIYYEVWLADLDLLFEKLNDKLYDQVK